MMKTSSSQNILFKYFINLHRHEHQQCRTQKVSQVINMDTKHAGRNSSVKSLWEFRLTGQTDK